MDQSLENKPEFKNRLINFYNLNKVKILIFLVILLLSISSTIFIKHNNNKKNILIAEKYIEAGLLIASEKREDAKILYEEIILSDNKFYPILALNSIIEKKLISDNKKLLSYFNILEKNTKDKDQKDLIVLKKALYLIKNLNTEEGNLLLKKLIDQNSSLKSIAEEIIRK